MLMGPKFCPFLQSYCKGESCALFVSSSPVSPYACAIKLLAVSAANPRELKAPPSVIPVTVVK